MTKGLKSSLLIFTFNPVQCAYKLANKCALGVLFNEPTEASETMVRIRVLLATLLTLIVFLFLSCGGGVSQALAQSDVASFVAECLALFL